MDIIYSSTSVKVVNSCEFHDKSLIKDCISVIKASLKCPMQVKERTDLSLYREWRAHNNLYRLHLFRQTLKM